MKSHSMNMSDLPLLVLLRLSLLVVLAAAPNEFWAAVAGALAIPVEVKILTAPLLGSACATAVEYLILLRKHTPSIYSPIYWPLKVFVGWIVGSFGGTAMEGLVNATPQAIAFWAGVTGYGAIALVLANQDKKLNDKNDTMP
jgi:hypothetical protein